jgi:hypothetical protein
VQLYDSNNPAEIGMQTLVGVEWVWQSDEQPVPEQNAIEKELESGAQDKKRSENGGCSGTSKHWFCFICMLATSVVHSLSLNV